MDCPVSLKSVKPYLDRASEVQAKDPIVAYHCRLFALQEAMKLRASVPKADMGFVLSLMDQCEKEKGALGEMDEPAITVENFAQDLFQRADDADRAGRSDLRTGKAFLAASHIFDVCKQFEELPADISEKAKYAKWRFVEIAKATTAAFAPMPGFKPTRAAIQEAQRVVQQASSALAFQDSDTATQKLLLALNLLTQPPPPPPPE